MDRRFDDGNDNGLPFRRQDDVVVVEERRDKLVAGGPSRGEDATTQPVTGRERRADDDANDTPNDSGSHVAEGRTDRTADDEAHDGPAGDATHNATHNATDEHADVPAHDATHDRAHAPAHDPARDPAHDPAHDSARDPGSDTAHDTGHDTGHDTAGEQVHLPEDTPGEVREEVEHGGTGPDPAHAVPAQATHPDHTGDGAPRATPGTAGQRGGEALFTRDTEDVRRRWHEVAVGFVDDPRAAVERADGLLGEVIEDIHNTLNARGGKLRERWKGDGAHDTEQLRQALREYRAVLERLLELSPRK